MKTYTLHHTSNQSITFLIDSEKLYEPILEEFLIQQCGGYCEDLSLEEKLHETLKTISADILKHLTYDDSVDYIKESFNNMDYYIKLDGSQGIELFTLNVLEYFEKDFEILTSE